MTDEPKKRRVNYDTTGTEEYSRMQTAVREVWRVGSNVNMTDVARMNGVKLQTLRNHVARAKPTWNETSFKHLEGMKRGKKPVMAKEFESLLVDHIHSNAGQLEFCTGERSSYGYRARYNEGDWVRGVRVRINICTLETFLLISLLKMMISSSGV